jgi:hypothetical protein
MYIPLIFMVGMSRVYPFSLAFPINFYLINNVLLLEKLGNGMSVSSPMLLTRYQASFSTFHRI